MQHNKLVRDKIPEICRQHGAIPITRVLNETEYKAELDAKLKEEIEEYLSDDNIEELADILEVVYAIAVQKGISQTDLEKVRAQKAEKRGSFNKRIYLEETKETI